MSDQPGIVGPDYFAIRHPTDKKQENGRIVNPPRYMDGIGGLTGPEKWDAQHIIGSQSPQKNMITLEKGGPTGVKGAHSTKERDI